MNELVLEALRSEVLERYGRSQWNDVHEAADVEPQPYIPSSQYEDALVDSLVDVTVETTEWDRSNLLADIGESIGPELLTIIQVEVDSDWSALAVIEKLDHIFEQIYQRNRFSSYDSSALECTVAGDETVFVEFRSRTSYCSLFEGVFEAIGERYGQPLAVTHRGCGGRSDGSDCTLLVSTARGKTAAVEATATDELKHPGA